LDSPKIPRRQGGSVAAPPPRGGIQAAGQRAQETRVNFTFPHLISDEPMIARRSAAPPFCLEWTHPRTAAVRALEGLKQLEPSRFKKTAPPTCRRLTLPTTDAIPGI